MLAFLKKKSDEPLVENNYPVPVDLLDEYRDLLRDMEFAAIQQNSHYGPINLLLRKVLQLEARIAELEKAQQK